MYFQIPGWGMWSRCYLPARPSSHPSQWLAALEEIQQLNKVVSCLVVSWIVDQGLILCPILQEKRCSPLPECIPAALCHKFEKKCLSKLSLKIVCTEIALALSLLWWPDCHACWTIDCCYGWCHVVQRHVVLSTTSICCVDIASQLLKRQLVPEKYMDCSTKCKARTTRLKPVILALPKVWDFHY